MRPVVCTKPVSANRCQPSCSRSADVSSGSRRFVVTRCSLPSFTTIYTATVENENIIVSCRVCSRDVAERRNGRSYCRRSLLRGMRGRDRGVFRRRRIHIRHRPRSRNSRHASVGRLQRCVWSLRSRVRRRHFDAYPVRSAR